MKYTIFQLRKLNMPFSVEESIDFSKDLDGFEDIIRSSIANVKETIRRVNDDTFIVEANIKISLVIESSISLDEITQDIDLNESFEYTLDKSLAEDSDAILIENNTVDTYDAILTEILCNKPMTSIIDGEEFVSDEVSTEDESDEINPSFAGLADLLKK